MLFGHGGGGGMKCGLSKSGGMEVQSNPNVVSLDVTERRVNSYYTVMTHVSK